MNCDFCCVEREEEDLKRYKCASFVPAMVVSERHLTVLESEGDWGACAECAALIDTNQWRRLAERYVELSPPSFLSRETMIRLIMDYHAQFHNARLL